jgi:microcompartment protein CcmK/EutM
MLIVQPLDRKGAEKGAPVVAADATRMAGPGQVVLFEGGREAALALTQWFVPVDHSIIGLVDQVSRPGWKEEAATEGTAAGPHPAPPRRRSR